LKTLKSYEDKVSDTYQLSNIASCHRPLLIYFYSRCWCPLRKQSISKFQLLLGPF